MDQSSWHSFPPNRTIPWRKNKNWCGEYFFFVIRHFLKIRPFLIIQTFYFCLTCSLLSFAILSLFFSFRLFRSRRKKSNNLIASWLNASPQSTNHGQLWTRERTTSYYCFLLLKIVLERFIEALTSILIDLINCFWILPRLLAKFVSITTTTVLS